MGKHEDEELSATREAESRVPRKCYESPRVTVLGAIETLTAGGMGADGDITSSQPT